MEDEHTLTTKTDEASRIAHGPVFHDEAMAIARQMTDALEAAHEAGIIHRDLKPEISTIHFLDADVHIG